MAEDVFGLVGTLQAGTFQVEAAVAEGGFGVVYRAHHTAFRAPVALKCLKVPSSLTTADRQEFEEQFRAEAELLFQLSAQTPTVVRPLQVGIASSPVAEFVPFMALEWLEGQSLDALVRERREAGLPPLGLEEAVHLLRPVAFALQSAHKFPGPKGDLCILHRDMKPDNVFIAEVRGSKAVRILDFGIAKVKSTASAVVGKASAQQSTWSAFTPGYGAPEQWVPKRYGQTGPWTDVYGFALTVVEAICGRTPVEGDHAALMGAALDEKLRPTPRHTGAQVTDDVEAVFEQALAVDPRHRFNSIKAFWNALEAAVQEQGAGRAAATAVQRVPPLGALSSRPPDPHGATRLNRAEAPAVAIPDLVADEPVAPRRPAPAKPAGGIQIEMLDSLSDLELDGESARIQVADEYALAPAPAPPLAPALAPMDGLGLSPGPSRVLPRSQVTAVRQRRAFDQRRAVSSVKARLRTPLLVIGLGSAVAIAGYAYQVATGEVPSFGPVRPLFVAGPLVLLGVILAAIRLFDSES